MVKEKYMNTKELSQEEEKVYVERLKFIENQADNSFPKTWICPYHKIMVRENHECPMCKYPELEKGRHSDPIKNERERYLRATNPEYLEKRRQQVRERAEREKLRKKEHCI